MFVFSPHCLRSRNAAKHGSPTDAPSVSHADQAGKKGGVDLSEHGGDEVIHATQARVGGLLVVTGFVLVFALTSSWAIVAGATMLVGGGIILAIAVEPMLDQPVSRDDVADSAEPPSGMAA